MKGSEVEPAGEEGVEGVHVLAGETDRAEEKVKGGEAGDHKNLRRKEDFIKGKLGEDEVR